VTATVVATRLAGIARQDVAKVVESEGEFSWGGAASTIFWVDPREELVVIFMTQLMPSGTYNFRGQLKQLVHQAIAG
jgi:CubicO group peptidase (beta-lactamase class C family)